MPHSVSEIFAMHESMRSERKTFESHWSEVADRVIPTRSEFRQTDSTTTGEKRGQKIFDDTAALALPRFAAAIESIATPKAQRWHGLRTVDTDYHDDLAIKRYFEQVTNILFVNRYRPNSGFANQSNEMYLDWGAFGTGAMYVEDALGKGIRYSSVPLEQLFFALNQYGEVDKVHRDFQLTARQASQRWGDALPQQIKNVLQNAPLTKFRFLHVVEPNDEYDSRYQDNHRMAFKSCFYSYDFVTKLSEGGFRTMPFLVTRYMTSSKETYGRSPAMMVLNTIKALNEKKKTIERMGQKMVDPPLLAVEDGILQAFDLRAGAINYGGIDVNGNQTVQPLRLDGRLDYGLDLLQADQKTINEAFLITLFQILVETPQMTATEAMLRAQEKGALLAPTASRLENEFLGPLINREIDILAHAGVLPPMPQELIDIGGEIEIYYDSPMTKAMKAGDGVAILNTIQAIVPFAQIDPSVLKAFNMKEMVRIVADANGVPSKAMYTKEEMKEMEAADAQAAQTEKLLAAAPIAASSAKDLAQAQALAASAPNQQAPDLFGTS